MRPQMSTPPAPAPELYHYLRRSLFLLRWGTIAVLLLLTVMQPVMSRVGLPTWAFILLFGGYNLLIEVLRGRVAWLRRYTRVALLDLPVVGLLYALGGEPGGPLFLLLFLAVDCAAVSMPLRGALFYTVATMGITATTDVALLMLTPSPGDSRMLVARLAMLALVALGMAILTRRLTMEQESIQMTREINEQLLITSLKEREAALVNRLEADRLGALEQLRADFIATVSHDLQTPLTAARAGLALLDLDTPALLSAEQRDLLDTSRRNIEYLTILIGDLLTYNQLEAGTFQLEREPVDLRAVVATAMRVVHPLLREKGQSLEADLSEPLPCLGDMRRLEQVVINLLANAHRHTPSGSRIAISGRVAADTVQLTVSDNGPGIPDEEREAIFRRFHRLSVAGEGSGLGLAIARLYRRIAWWAPSRGQRAWRRRQLPDHTAEYHNGGDHMTLKVLIADDAADVAKMVAFGVRMTWPGCRVTVAADGEEALRCFAEDGADLVILDVSMPAPDGLAVCRQIRETSQVPILMLTVRGDIVSKVRAFDSGADDYLTKPYDPLELVARLRALARRAQAPQGATGPAFVAGDFSLDFTTHEVRVRDASVHLTSTEYRLLATLVRHAGTALPHEFLLREVWGPEYVGDAHYLKGIVRRLRQKLGDDPTEPRYIQTEWGIGYRFAAHR